jgi:LysM repeat protein
MIAMHEADEQDEQDRAARRATRLVAASSMGALLVLTAALAHGNAPSTANADTAATQPTPDSVAAVVTTAAAGATVATTVATTTTAPATTTTTCAATYTVQSGDSWYLLAQEASIGVDALFVANGASSATALHPGQSICLPDGAVVVTTTAPPVTTAKPATTVAPVRTTLPAPSHTTAASG